MSSYIQETLIGGEEVVYQAKVSIWALASRILLGVLFVLAGIMVLISGSAIFGLILLVLGVVILLMQYLTYISTELAFTNKRIIAKFGFISRETIELGINKVETVRVSQGVIGRIFNYGSIIIAGAGASQAPIPYISNPMKFRSEVMGYINK